MCLDVTSQVRTIPPDLSICVTALLPEPRLNTFLQRSNFEPATENLHAWIMDGLATDSLNSSARYAAPQPPRRDCFFHCGWFRLIL
jgi:hypothetical protein